MTRFGSHDMPLWHGIASCVDYLTGYLGAFAAVTARCRPVNDAAITGVIGSTRHWRAQRR
jgi:hypothetical protein